MTIIDFHNHFVGGSFELTTLRSVPPAALAQWHAINARLASIDSLLSSLDESRVDARVINTPPGFLEDADGSVHSDTVRRVNDHLAEVTARSSGRLIGLATVDPFSGETGARELTRAVCELGLRGVFLECAKGDLLLDAPQARPILAAAARLEIPAFIHPVADPQLQGRFGRLGRIGTLLARGTINSASLFAMIQAGVFDEHPGLNVVVTTLAIGGLMLAAGMEKDLAVGADAPPSFRRHVYIDTMGLDATLIGAAVNTVGADHVVMGTDWPVVVERGVPERLNAAFDRCGLGTAERDMIAHGNARRLLKIANPARTNGPNEGDGSASGRTGA